MESSGISTNTIILLVIAVAVIGIFFLTAVAIGGWLIFKKRKR